jgi:putative nucleotidyltransferase with HDIG domain
MNFISFKSLKLFKGPSSRPSKNGAPPAANADKRAPWLRLVQSPFFYMAIFVFVLAYSLSYVPSASLPEAEEGAIASSDIVSPIDLTIEDTETTEKKRAEAEEAVLPVYTFDENAFLNTEEKIRQFFEFSREWLKGAPARKDLSGLQKGLAESFDLDITVNDLDSLVKAGFSQDLEETLISLVGKVSSQGIIVSKNFFIRREPERGFILIRGPGNERLTKTENILEIREAKQKIAEDVNQLEISSRNKKLLISLADLFITPNITYNRTETEARKERERERVETVFYRIKKGKVVVRKGDEATAENLKWIDLINHNLQKKRGWLRNFSGTFLLFALILVAVWYYLKSLLGFKPAHRTFIMIGVTLILSLLAYKLSNSLASLFSGVTKLPVLTNAEVYTYAFPYQFGVILFAFLTTNTISLVFCILNSVLVGYLLQANYLLTIFSFLGGLGAIYGIKYYQRAKRTSTLQTGLFVVVPVNVFLIAIFEQIQERPTDLGYFGTEIGMGILGGILSAAIAFVLLPLIENVFGIVTQSKLLELSNSDLPIFKQMAMQAPGSYHHSLIVASLAEKAAEEIRLDPMLVKAGALYHDIGKVKRPEYFVENISRNPDLHKDMSPSLSTLVITNHVKEGVEIAKKLKLPKKIKEIVEQHHGTSLVRYFYHKAQETYDPEMHKIGEESYRYPGPSPQSKEAALVMLADSIEAASRSLKAPTKESLKRVIVEIFESNLQDGQLDDCDFSLRELRAIAASFHNTLYTIYHPRVEYPGFDFEMKKKKKGSNSKRANDRSPQPPGKVLDQQE